MPVLIFNSMMLDRNVSNGPAPGSQENDQRAEQDDEPDYLLFIFHNQLRNHVTLSVVISCSLQVDKFLNKSLLFSNI